jgi:hypothetical protein
MLDKENLTVLTDAISKIMNKEYVTEEIEIELNEAYMIKHRNTGFLTKVGKDGNLMFKPSKKGAVKYKDQKAADDAMAGMIKDYAPYGGGTLSVVKESTEITEKLKAAKGKSVLDIDFAGDESEMDGMSSKYKIKMKKGKIKGTALVAGENKNILAYLQSDDYDMDDENIMDIYPEVVAEAYDRDKLVNKMMKPIKDKEKMFPKSKKEASGDKEEYQKFFTAALKKFGVKSPAELKGDKEKEFYNYIDKNWKADHEESVELALEFGTPNMSAADKANLRRRIKDMQKKESVEEARKEPWIPFAKSDAFITKDRDPETGRGEFYNVRSGEGFKIIKTFKTMKDAEKFLDKINKMESVEEQKPYVSSMDGKFDVLDAKGKVAFTTKDSKEAEKFLKINYKMLMKEHVGANGHAGPVQDIDQGLSPKAKLVKAFQEPETPDYADANKTALSTFANIMNSVNVAMDYRASDNKVQDVAPENTIQKLANSTK